MDKKFMLQDNYNLPNLNNWEGRVDAVEGFADSNQWKRIHQVVQAYKTNEPISELLENRQPVLLGYAVDEGVMRNGGRVGAANGPEAFRKYFGNLPLPNRQFNLLDAGDIICRDEYLAQATLATIQLVQKIFDNGGFPMVIGGGHDVSYAHMAGVLRSLRPSSVVGVINFDAHLDTRSYTEESFHSGASFSRLLEEFKNRVSYMVVGVRKTGNTLGLIEKTRRMGGQILFSDEIRTHMEHVQESIVSFLKQADAVCLTIDLDVFNQSLAPGVSAPHPAGLSWKEFLSLFNQVIRSEKLISADIAEFNPGFDIDGITGKLAAEIAWRILEK